jgi:hypothetical protein
MSSTLAATKAIYNVALNTANKVVVIDTPCVIWFVQVVQTDGTAIFTAYDGNTTDAMQVIQAFTSGSQTNYSPTSQGALPWACNVGLVIQWSDASPSNIAYLTYSLIP